jgi:hypothetical protein
MLEDTKELLRFRAEQRKGDCNGNNSPDGS